MDFCEYAVKSEYTIKKSDDRQASLYHAVCGIITEVKELEEAFTLEHRVEELGDICWYLALLYKHIPFAFGSGCSNVVTHNKCLKDMKNTAIELIDKIKAHNQYERDNISEIEHKASKISNYIFGYCFNTNIDLNHVFKVNIDKLHKVRYKKGFNSDDANNRDIEAENKELGK